MANHTRNTLDRQTILKLISESYVTHSGDTLVSRRELSKALNDGQDRYTFNIRELRPGEHRIEVRMRR